MYSTCIYLFSDSDGGIFDLASEDDEVVNGRDEVHSQVIDLHERVRDHHQLSLRSRHPHCLQQQRAVLKESNAEQLSNTLISARLLIMMINSCTCACEKNFIITNMNILYVVHMQVIGSSGQSLNVDEDARLHVALLFVSLLGNAGAGCRVAPATIWRDGQTCSRPPMTQPATGTGKLVFERATCSRRLRYRLTM